MHITSGGTRIADVSLCAIPNIEASIGAHLRPAVAHSAIIGNGIDGTDIKLALGLRRFEQMPPRSRRGLSAPCQIGIPACVAAVN